MPTTAQFAEAALKHRIPVIDRMMDVLSQLERRDAGLTIRDLVTQLHLPRTTIYRILNTLQMHEIVYRSDTGAYQLGPRLLSLASHVSTGAAEIDLAAVAQPSLDQLAADLGEGIKLSVLDKSGLLVLATAQGRRENALTVTPGQRIEPHAGAAGKLLLAYLDEPDLAHWLIRPLTAYTNRTLTDARRLKTENANSIHAFAAPVFDTRKHMIAALSVPFLAGTETPRMEEIRLATVAAARTLSASVPGPIAR
jgi:DNA-binding IclR family transcriptional regulator